VESITSAVGTRPHHQRSTLKSRYYCARDRAGRSTCLGGWLCTLFEEFELMRIDLGQNIFKIMINSNLIV